MLDDRHAVQVLARVLVGLPVEESRLAALDPSWHALADVIAGAGEVDTRIIVLGDAVKGRPDGQTVLVNILTAARTAHVVPEDAPAEHERLVFLSDVESTSVRWLWPGRVPLGKLTVLDGDPGLGKSAITLDLAARVSRGSPMPDHTLGDLDGPRGVVLLSAEDGLADTIRPRLHAAGADLARVVALTAVNDSPVARGQVRPTDRPSPRLPTLGDLFNIRRAAAAIDAALVVVDPIMAQLPKGASARNEAHIRALLARLAGLTQADDLAILVVRHLTKLGRGNPLYRGGGSIGIIGAARSGLLAAKDPADPTDARRVLAPTKANLTLVADSLAYHLTSADNGSLRVAWEGPSDHTAATLLDGVADQDRADPAVLTTARNVLRSLLADGPKLASDVQVEARTAGISVRTLRRACQALAIRPRKDGFQGAWIWELPTPSDDP